jgi:predicted dinucleotide-binding enzyme
MPDRIAVAAVGDHRLAVHTVMHLLDRLGFDPVDAGPLAKGSCNRRGVAREAQRDRVHPGSARTLLSA